MPEYTYKDVIIDPEDPRVEIGAEYYFGDNPVDALRRAKRDGVYTLKYVNKDTEEPFISCGDFRYSCIIRKKEPENRYVPFDLLKEEDRAKLRGAWVRVKDIPTIEYQITGMNAKYVLLGTTVNLETDDLLRSYELVDGTPCGQLVEAN